MPSLYSSDIFFMSHYALRPYTQMYWGIQALPLPSFMPWFFCPFRSFDSFFGPFTILRNAKSTEIYADLMRYDGIPWSVFNFNVNIYLTCQTCEINPLKIVAQNTLAHILSFGNREKSHSHTPRQSIIGRQKVSFDIFLCRFSFSSNEYYVSFANVFTLYGMEKLQLRPILRAKMEKKVKVAWKKQQQPTATTAG